MSHILLRFSMVVVSLLLACIDARAQGVLDTLRQMENKPAPAQSLSAPTLKEMCLIAEREAGAAKCRGFYLSTNFVSEWRGVDSSSSHPFALEVLTRGDDAVLCYGLDLF